MKNLKKKKKKNLSRKSVTFLFSHKKIPKMILLMYV